mgnify:CR=1 FL=1
MTYYILVSFHLLSIIIWVSSLFYLYGLNLIQKNKNDKTLIDKGLQIYKQISNPALLVALIFGITLLVLNKTILETGFWIYVKFFLISLMILMHFAYKIEINLVKNGLKVLKKRVIISHIYSLFILLGIVILLIKTKSF